MNQFPIILTKELDPKKRFCYNGKPLDFSIVDFWKWNQSDFIENRNRGILAEYLIKQALGIESSTRLEWDSFDFKTKENVKIEVKSAAFIQAWEQTKLSSIRFDIAPKRTLLKDGNYSEKKVRNSDLYIFCLLHHKDQNTINPMDLSQWTFYLVLTEEINQTCKDQLSVGISTLERLRHIKTDFIGIKQSYLKAISTIPNIQYI
ncbi:MAG TPA: hypothetical protein GXZ56_09575 [Bacteroidales bacterium]|nr:hypothetical protein [Bacteroidales bacterium]